MKKIIILGNTFTGAKAAEEIRLGDHEAPITLICTDGRLPYIRHLFADFLNKRIKEEEVFYQNEKYYKERQIQIVNGKKIVRINFKKNRIVTEEKEEFEYDILILADIPGIRLPELKGIQKTGVFSLKRLTDVQDLAALLPMIDTVAMDVDDLLSLKLASDLRLRKKEVIFVSASDHILSNILDDKSAQLVMKSLEAGGVQLILKNEIKEILGDSDAKAIRLKNGKVLACQAVILGNAKSDWRLLNETELEIDRAILVDSLFRTNLENVFALDRACEMRDEDQDSEELSVEDLGMQAKAAAFNILGQQALWQPSLNWQSLTVFDLSLSLIGFTKTQDGCSILSRSDQDQNIHQSLFIKENSLVGAVLINNDTQKQKCERLIKEKVNILGLEEHVFGQECNFDQIKQLADNRAPSGEGASHFEAGASAVTNPQASENSPTANS